MTRLVLALIFLSSIHTLSGCKSGDGPAVDINDSSSPNVFSKVTNILPNPGSVTASSLQSKNSVGPFAVTQPNCNDWDGSPARPDWFRTGWMGYSMFSLMASPSGWDPTTDCWGVENMQNNIRIASELWDALTRNRSGSISGTVLGLSYEGSSSAVETGEFTYSDPLAPQLDVSDITYKKRRTLSLTVEGSETMDFEVAWVRNGNEYDFLIGMASGSGEKTIMTAYYNFATKEVQVTRHTLTGGNSAFFMEISGIESTAQFEVKYYVDGNTRAISVFATGFAEENTASNHFVVRLKQDLLNNDLSDNNNFYFCVKSSVTDANFETFFNANGANNFADTTNGLYGNESNIADTLALDVDGNDTLDLNADYAACDSGTFASAAEAATLPDSGYVSLDPNDYSPDSIVE